ncbi:hypothetical protein ACFORJ_02730 [Corynebacterium hansenii]|uniref:AMIN-like domain-containing protein n=1 Tax=Corynebacterium hansenii TaxID=394964 RepID=A0ABV7ZKN3_9CORY|nr:hypothetical protein [Corynebacterium hansenii]WJY99087.1 hypothetical protein CHAN_02280 [Corynebacterium hansenii]
MMSDTRTSLRSNRAAVRSVVAVLAAGSLALGLAACSPGGDAGADSAVSMRNGDSPSSSGGNGNGDRTTGGSPATLEADAAPEGEYSAAPAEAAPADGSYLGIKDVRIGSHDGFDRIVIEFMGDGAPGYWVRYEDMPTQQGSGKPISISGAHKLAIDVRGTGYPFDFNVDDYPNGPVKPKGTSAISEVRGFGTFEGTTQYVAGIDGERRPFKVFKAKNPTRLIIDIEAR